MINITSQRDRILSDLEFCGGKASQSMIARRTKLKQEELDSILEELEHEALLRGLDSVHLVNGPREN